MSVKVSIVNKSPHPLPQYQTDGAAGVDIRVWLPEAFTLKPMERKLLPTGLYIALPEHYEAQIRPRSGTAIKRGITLINSPGTIDADYRGEIMLPVINLSEDTVEVMDGERLAQMIFAKFEVVEWQAADRLEGTKREDGAFGHTGNT